jgi:hypothetical protein
MALRRSNLTHKNLNIKLISEESGILKIIAMKMLLARFLSTLILQSHVLNTSVNLWKGISKGLSLIQEKP